MKDASPVRVAIVRSRAIDPAVNKVAQALKQSGYSVDLLVWSREGAVKESDRDDCCHTRRFNLKAPYYSPALLLYLPVWWFYEFFALLRGGARIIHACDLDTLIPAVLVKLIKRTRLCYFIYDFYADILPRQVPGPLVRMVAFTEKFLIKFTDALFLVDSRRQQQVRGAKIKRIEYIYNSPEDYLKDGAEPEAAPGVSIFYAGYLDRSRGLEAMIHAVSEMAGVRLTLAGTGPVRETIEQDLAKIPALQFLGQIPYDEVIRRELAADILFAFYDPGVPSNRYASPNKLFEAMMCAKPIIINEGITACQIVAEEKCGLIVPYGDAAAIKEAISSLKNDPGLRCTLGQNGRRAYQARYSWDIMRKRLADVYGELVKAPIKSQRLRGSN